jgi:hypothetical protein
MLIEKKCHRGCHKACLKIMKNSNIMTLFTTTIEDKELLLTQRSD